MTTVLALVCVAVTTMLLRVAAPLLLTAARLTSLSQRLDAATPALLGALVATASLGSHHGPVVDARAAAVLVAGALALRRAPLLVTLLAAISVAAGARMLAA